MTARVLVVGARSGSLGEALRTAAPLAGFEVHCAGISGEPVRLDALNMPMSMLHDIMMSVRPTHVLCTIGMNLPRGPESARDPFDWYRWHFETNVIAPMRLFEAFKNAEFTTEPGKLCHYVVVSSNSARIPRSASGAYCASKAALSMAVRVAAREAHGGDRGYIVYGYEPGLLAGTPMTADTAERWPGVPLTRMRGTRVQHGIPVGELAAQMVANLKVPGAALNGALLPFDADEL